MVSRPLPPNLRQEAIFSRPLPFLASRRKSSAAAILARNGPISALSSPLPQNVRAAPGVFEAPFAGKVRSAIL